MAVVRKDSEETQRGGKLELAMPFGSKETPPEDDVCPICFGDFVIPCRADCGHWFCGSCILQVWDFSSAFQACKCPMCCSRIKTLKPEEFMHQKMLQDGEEARKVLKSIERYNRLFVGGALGFFLKLYDVPLFLRRVFREMTDPNQVDRHIHTWRLLAFVLGLSYMISPFNFFPDGVNVMPICNCAALFMVLVVKITGLYQSYRSEERVIRLDVLETHEERGS